MYQSLKFSVLTYKTVSMLERTSRALNDVSLLLSLSLSFLFVFFTFRFYFSLYQYFYLLSWTLLVCPRILINALFLSLFLFSLSPVSPSLSFPMKCICVIRSYKSTILRRESDIIIKVIYVARFYAHPERKRRSPPALGFVGLGLIIVRESTLSSGR